MAEDIFAEIMSQALGLLIEAAFALWQEIVLWTCATLLLWVQTDMIPLMADAVELAFMMAAVVTASLLRAMRAAWADVRKVLLEAFIEFEQSTQSSDKWIKRITATLISSIETAKPLVVRKEVVEEVDWDKLPDDVREAWLKSAHPEKHKVDIVDAREKQLEIMTLTH